MSIQSEVVSQKKTKRLRIYSDDEEDEGYEPDQKRRSSYNKSYTRGRTGGSSPPEQSKRQKVSAQSSCDGEESDYETRTRDRDSREEEDTEEEEMSARSDARGNASAYMENNEDDNDGYGSERLSRTRRTSDSSSFTFSRRNDSSPGVPTEPPQISVPTSSSNNRTVRRKPSMRVKEKAVTTASTKQVTAKGKQKGQSSGRWKRRQGDDSGDEEYHEDEVNVDEEDEEDETRYYEERDQSRRKKQGRRAGDGDESRTRDKDKDKDVAKNVKFEGIPSALSSTNALTTTTMTKRTRTRKPTGEDAVVDVVDETETLDPLNNGSPSATNVNEGGKDDDPGGLALPAKKRKLPTIKKIKNTTGGSGPSAAPNSLVGAGSKPPTLPPSGGVTGNKPTEVSKARPKTNATSDLDLSNPSLYAELFKNVSFFKLVISKSER